MKISAFGNRLARQAFRCLPVAATVFVIGSTSAYATVDGGRNFISAYDVALMLASGIGLMVFVARHRRKGGRDDE